ncbi:MAG TPA: serine hydrolase [Dehalococcoidia bacterium]|nr:serine hydrolase [Dehalococcoidia bacterium]
MPSPVPTVAVEPPAQEPEPEVRCPSPFPGEGTSEAAAPRLTPTADDVPPLPPFAPLALVPDPELEARIRERLERQEEGVYAVVVKRIDDGVGVAIDADHVFYAASLFKVAVMIEAFHQRDAGLLDFGESYVVSDYYDGFDLGPGVLRRCQTVTLEEALRAMMAVSDNVAAVLLQDRVGERFVNETLSQLGAQDTALLSDDLPTTAADQALLMEAIARGEAVSREASQEMLNLLGSETFDFGLPQGLPEGTLVAHKTGLWHNATHDAGIVFAPSGPYVIAVLTDGGFESDAADVIADVSRIVYERFEDRFAAPPPEEGQ